MDPSPYLKRIRDCFPALEISAVHFNPDALTNNVFIINDELVFRFPKNAEFREQLKLEARLLELVRRHVSLPVPFFEHQEEDFVMYRFLPGQPLYRHDWLRQEPIIQERIAEQLGTFLKQLHTIPLEPLQQAGLALPSPEHSIAEWQERFQAIEQEIYPFLWKDQRDWVAHLFEPVLEGTVAMGEFQPALIHNDLAPYHILYDPDRGQLGAVIDFGVAKLSDPAHDFAIIINVYGESLLRQVAPFYPEIQPALDRARLKAGAMELEWALKGVRSKDTAWLLVHLGRARDVLPVRTEWS